LKRQSLFHFCRKIDKTNNLTRVRNTIKIVVIFLAGLTTHLQSQNIYFDKNYFLFPIRPTQQAFLSGGFAELRSNHFHGGIDIKTDGRIGLPVYAVADGYVSRIKSSAVGYGNALYLKHPNGKISVYGHLEQYPPALEKYLVKQQYIQQNAEIDIENIEPTLFPFKKGEIIGYSGNTGSSAGPHLHFEIRTEDDIPLDPLLFGFREVHDNLPPVIEKIALTCLSPDARINGEHTRKEFSVYKSGHTYRIAERVYAVGKIGIEYKGYDIANKANNHYGINYLTIKLNGQHFFQQAITHVPFHLRAIHVHTHYPIWKQKGDKFVRAYLLDGNTLPFYEPFQNGILSIQHRQPYQIKMMFQDSYANTSFLEFDILGNADYLPDNTTSSKKPTTYSVEENWLKINSWSTLQADTCLIHIKDSIYKIGASYQIQRSCMFIWDLRNGIPDSIQTSFETLPLHFADFVPPKQNYDYYGNRLHLRFGQDVLFDTLYLQIQENQENFTINTEYVPLLNPVEIHFKPDELLGELGKYVGICHISGKGKLTWLETQYDGETLKAYSKELGNFTLQTDTEPPKATLINKSPSKLTFKLYDNLSGIRSYKGYINGEYVLIRYDAKSQTAWTVQQDDNTIFKGKFILQLIDKAGNQAFYEVKL